ncbi:hypothetical protein FOA52_011883 [Chlamydomonas sp. UWO 241]|nr:hypothetical protein FOA52_011883 [Chlamydomonas sp. UWO 241]
MRTFLETRGAGLAHTGEFLAYYALPYVPNPEHHPSFEHLFTDSWVANQRQAMRLYLESMPDGSETPTLYSMFDSWQTATDATTRLSPRALSTRDGVRTPGRGANPKPAPGRIATGFSSMLRQQAAGSGARAVAMLAKSKNAASGGTANGHHVLGGVGGSILDSRQQPQHQQGGGRPAWPGIERGGDDDGCGGAHARTRSSLSLAGTTSLSEELDLMDDVLQSTVNLPEATARAMAAMASMALADEAAAAVLEASGGSSSRPSGAPPPLTAEDSLMATPAPRMIAPLSYDMVVDSVVVGAQERGPAGALAASLLQALRWRLVHSTQRRQVLSTWVEADLLRVNAPQHEQVLHIASHSSEAHVLEEVARLANGIASDRLGRTYLLSTGSSAVASLVRMAQRSAASRFEAAAANGVHQRTWSAGGGQRLAHAHGGGTATPAPPALSRADSFKRPSPSYTRRLPGRSGGGSRDPNDAAFFDAAPQASSSNQHRRAAWPLAPLASKSQTLRGASPDGAAVPPYAANRRATEPVISTMFDARASGGSHCSGSGGSALRSGVSSMAGGVGCSSEHGSRVPTPPLAGGGAAWEPREGEPPGRPPAG